jgi:hypothetical protein
MRRTSVVCLLALAALGHAEDQAVKVRYPEGSARGFLVLRNQSGATLASGEYSEVPQGDTIKSRMFLRFRDGSLHQETTVYSQKLAFRLISDHLVQKGRSFPNPCDMMIDVRSQSVSMLAPSSDGKAQPPEHMDLPSDLSNGILFNLIKNLRTDAPEIKVSYLAPAAKPRMVKFAISVVKEGKFTVAGRSLKAAEWTVKAELGGLAGIVAPMIGKQPPDTHVWVAEGTVPAIVRVDTTLYAGGPVWSIQLASPTFDPASSTAASSEAAQPMPR